MKKMIQVILVNHNPDIKREVETSIEASGIACNIKTVLNGGHALLHLFQLHLHNRLSENQVLIILNLNTPIVDGLEFLKEFRTVRDFKKENISIAVLDNDLTLMQKTKAENLGACNFLSSALFPAFLAGLEIIG
jgi:DNA-binding response OmpR family regulator